MQQINEIQALLAWQMAMGVSETIADTPTNHRIMSPPKPLSAPKAEAVAVTPPPPPAALADAIAAAQSAAASADNLAALQQAIEGFTGCSLKKTARHSVLMHRPEPASLLILGDTPDADDDRSGQCFNGQAGLLLDKMLASIGLSRDTDCLLAHAIAWRPPGNRAPTAEEMAICTPFTERLIALCKPKLLITLSNPNALAAQMLLKNISNLRQLRSQSFSAPLTYTSTSGDSIPVLPLTHPSLLLRQPTEKRIAWQELQRIAQHMTAS
jgi:uracil-DNA glycosylase